MLSSHEITMLAEVERKMDSMEIPYVILEGQRVATSRECMKEFSLEAGQTINQIIFTEMLRFNLADVQAKIAIQKTQNSEGIERKTA